MSDKLSRDAVLLSAVLFVVGWGTNVSTPFLVLYKERLDLGNNATVGIFVVYVLGILGALFLAGPLSNRLGRKPLVLPFTIISGLASIVMIFGRDYFAALLLGRLMLGMASGAVLGVGSAWMLELLGPGNELRSAVITTVVTYTGFGFGPVVSTVYERFFDAPLVVPFLIHALVTALVVLAFGGIRETHARNPEASLRTKIGIPPNARRTFFLVVVPAAIWVFAFPSMGFALFPVLLSDATDGSPVLLAGMSGALTAWGAMVARPLVNRIGPSRALPYGMSMGIGGYIAGTTAFGTGWWGLALPAALMLGAASGVISAGCLAILGGLANDDTRSQLTSTFFLLAYPGMAMPLIVTSAATLIGDSFGPSGLTVALLGLTTIAIGAAILASTAAARPQPSTT